MTFEEATPYIQKICWSWAKSYPQFEADELFNEVWLCGEDISRLGDSFPLIGCHVSRRIMAYMRKKCGSYASYRYRGHKATRTIEGVFGNYAKDNGAIARIDNREECELLISCLSPKQRRVVLEYFAGRKMGDIGDDLGVGRAEISRLKQQALHKIRCVNKVA